MLYGWNKLDFSLFCHWPEQCVQLGLSLHIIISWFKIHLSYTGLYMFCNVLLFMFLFMFISFAIFYRSRLTWLCHVTKNICDSVKLFQKIGIFQKCWRRSEERKLWIERLPDISSTRGTETTQDCSYWRHSEQNYSSHHCPYWQTGMRKII